MNISDLAQRFGIAGHVTIDAGKGGLALIAVTARGGSALISPYAGQVLSFRPEGGDDLMFLSDSAYYAPGKAIKGGIPICWPWFGPAPEGLGRPGHGFVRNRPWNLISTERLADGQVRIVLGLTDSDETRSIWPHAFSLTLEITVGATLELNLVTRNTGSAAFPLSQALHTYFRVGDITRTRVQGLHGCPYIDKMDGGVEKLQNGPVLITGETDRIYTQTTAPLTIEDDGLNRRIRIDSTGSASAVVWNPWQATAKAMADLGDEDYRGLICVETANAGPDIMTVSPGTEFRLGVRYSLD
jgi:glucose-6-phosphate 1-epimerase